MAQRFLDCATAAEVDTTPRPLPPQDLDQAAQGTAPAANAPAFEIGHHECLADLRQQAQFPPGLQLAFIRPRLQGVGRGQYQVIPKSQAVFERKARTFDPMNAK